MTLHLFLRPMDVWLFRDGRPFDAGSAHRAESVFPPYSTVIQGAFRTHRLLARGVDLTNKKAIEEAVGKADEFGSLRLRGPYLAAWDGKTITRYFPQPADAIADGLEFLPAELNKPNGTLKANSPFPLLFGLKQHTVKPKESLWVDENALKDYLEGKPAKGVTDSSLFLREDRVGIGMDEKRVVDEGMLYETEFIRPREGVGLLMEIEGDYEAEWKNGGVVLLGGEGRQAIAEVVTAAPLSKPPASVSRFKIFFATPTYFKMGWIPATKKVNGKDDSDWSKFFKGDVTLAAAAINRYESIGGFNWADDANGAKAHRPARRFVPAGSVYYFEGKPELQPGLTQQAITDFGAEIGFGQTIIKEW